MWKRHARAGGDRRRAIDHMVTADAVLYPVNQANVTSKISAPIRRMLVNRGDHVRAGQIIAELETAIWRRRRTRARASTNRRRRRFRRSPGDGRGRQEQSADRRRIGAAGSGRGEEGVRQPRGAAEQGALAQKLVDDARVALVQAQSRSKPPSVIWRRCSRWGSGSRSRAQGAGGRGESALRERRRAAFLRGSRAARFRALSPTGRFIPVRARRAVRRSFRSWISRRWWRAPTFR